MVKKENLEKLSQLDRIEYRQRKEGIKTFIGIYVILVYIIVAIGGIMVMCSLVCIEEYVIIWESFAFISFITSGVLMVAIIIEENKKTRELEKKYFDVEVKVRSKK